jgi:hypothetical protein
MKTILLLASVALLSGSIVLSSHAAASEKIKLTISGGHDTDPRDHGRPVMLIGNALGVTPEIFRDAFSHVTPAPAGTEPAGDQIRRNKAALLGALAKHGVNNDRLDEVSNYYRYQPGRGRLWPTSQAEAEATLDNGKIISITILKSGSGYTSAPKITVPNHPEITLKPKLAYGKDFNKNGSIAEITERER